MRTYSRSQWEEAQRLWDEGEFSDEWKPVRHRAAMVGSIIYPPEGTRWDSWEDDSPSQRAMLIRAIRETPKLLDRCLVGAGSWAVVIERMLKTRDEWREEIAANERSSARQKDADTPSRSEMMTAGSVLRRWLDSM